MFILFNSTCNKYIYDLYDLYLQLIICIAPFIILFIKWMLFEESLLSIFILDISKQIVSYFIIHSIIVSTAYFISYLYSNTDSCGWYFVCFFIYNIFTPYIIYEFMLFISYYSKKYNINSLIYSGFYENNNKNIICIWFLQLISWICVILSSYIIIFISIIILNPIFLFIAEIIEEIFLYKSSLIFIFIPMLLLCNIIRIFLFHHILRHNKKNELEESLI